MKPDNMTWHEYISQGNFVDIKSDPKYKEYRDLIDIQQDLWALLYNNLIEANTPKIIVKEKTNDYAVKNKGCDPYSFRFQCIITGRKSRYIPVRDYPKFCITKSARTTGGLYPFLMEVEDQTEKPLIFLRERSSAINTYLREKYQTTWWERYSDYLSSKEWMEKREMVLNRDRKTCVITGEKNCILQVHHLTYSRVGDELMQDLVTLSKDAHKIIHDENNDTHGEYMCTLMEVLK